MDVMKGAQNITSDFEDSQTQILNRFCDWDLVPNAVDYIESLGYYGVGFVGVGSVLTALTFYFITDAVYNVISQKESSQYKTNCIVVLSVYPITSLCSLLATAIPRAQLLSESLTQICLMVSLYRLFLLLIDLGHRSVSKPPSMALKVGPCCCWPCLPFPNTEMNKSNLAWLRLCVLQLPIFQTLSCCVLLFLNAEEPVLAHMYGAYLQPMALTSLLFGLYGLTVTTKTLQECAPEAALPRRTMVSQMVLLFSKLQGFVVKSLPSTGVFPCHPPLTPQIYANLTYNCLMLVEMLMLSCAARKIYKKTEKHEEAGIGETNLAKNIVGQTEVTNNNEMPNIQLPVSIAALTNEDVDSRMP